MIIIKTKNFEDAGVTNFGAICVNQIPGDPNSTKGNNARGVYWTKPDHTGKESLRDKQINENYNIFSYLLTKLLTSTLLNKMDNLSHIIFHS